MEGQMTAHRPALVLNADFRPLKYFPLSIMDWKDAVCAVVKDTVSVVAHYDDWIKSPSTSIQLPSVVALKEYVDTERHVAFTRFNIFLRDRFRCQYCGNKFRSEDLTFDHVKPRSKGGPTDWDNIVTACGRCNALKDDKHLTPRTMPRKPTIGELLRAQMEFPPKYLHETWLDFLYWDTEITVDKTA